MRVDEQLTYTGVQIVGTEKARKAAAKLTAQEILPASPILPPSTDPLARAPSFLSISAKQT